MMHTRRRAAAAGATTVATALAIVLTTLAPAHAEQVAVADPADSSQSNNDLRRAVFVHGADDVTVRVSVTDLRKQDNAGVIVYFDKRAKRRGPEFTLGVPLYQTSDEYVVYRAKAWRAIGDPVECDVTTRQRWKKDVVVVRGSRACFGDPDRLRFAVRMSDSSPGDAAVDWVIGRREFTGWLAPEQP